MRKEIVYAIIIGVVFGLIVAFGIWKTNKKLSDINNLKPISTPTATPGNPVNIGLTIAKPNDLSVSSESVVVVSGVTSPSVWVVVSGENDNLLTQANANGTFQQELNLTSGVNEIVCTAFDTNGKSTSDKIVVVYSSEFLPAQSNTASPIATDEIRQKVQAKVDEKLKKPVAYIGTTTDISENTIQVSGADFKSSSVTSKGDIKMISVDAETTYLKSSTSTKQLKFTDLAIGDYVVAMGYVNGNAVLEAQRVLVTDPISPTQRSAYMFDHFKSGKTLSTATELSTSKEFNIKKLDTKIKLDKITTDERLIITGTIKNDILEATKIFYPLVFSSNNQ